jgi:hypothetical protein
MPCTVAEIEAARGRGPILDLWRKNLPEASLARFDWLYEGGHARSWLLRGDDQRPIGSGGMRVRRMQAFGRDVLAGQAIDLNVDAGQRLLGPALALGRAVTSCVEANGLAFVYALAADDSEAVMKRLGYSPLGDLTRWVRPLKSAYKLRETPGLKHLAGAVGQLLDLALRMGSAERGYRRHPETSSALIERYDKPFDQLWQRGHNQFAILGERTAQYLDWRYARYPELPQHAFGVWRLNALEGYVVYSVDQQAYCEVSDLFACDAGQALTATLAEFLRFARDRGYVAVSLRFFGTSLVSQTLWRFGFRPRPGGRRVYIYTGNGLDAGSRQRLLDQENWFLTRADNDTDV